MCSSCSSSGAFRTPKWFSRKQGATCYRNGFSGAQFRYETSHCYLVWLCNSYQPRCAASSVFSSRIESIMHLIMLRLDHMTSGTQCQVKDDLVNQLIALNNKLNTLSPALLHTEQAREKVQQQRENLYVEIKRHRAKGHGGKPCPAAQRFPFR